MLSQDWGLKLCKNNHHNAETVYILVARSKSQQHHGPRRIMIDSCTLHSMATANLKKKLGLGDK